MRLRMAPRALAVRTRRWAFAIPFVLLFIVLLLIFGVTSAAVTWNTRRATSWRSSHELAWLAAASAFDEAAAAMRASVKVDGIPDAWAERDLGSSVSFPARISVPLTQQAFDRQSVRIGPVSFSTGSWVLQRSSSTSSNPQIREMAIIEMSVTVRSNTSRQEASARKVTVQRYAAAEPDQAGFGIKIYPDDLFHEEAEQN